METSNKLRSAPGETSKRYVWKLKALWAPCLHNFCEPMCRVAGCCLGFGHTVARIYKSWLKDQPFIVKKGNTQYIFVLLRLVRPSLSHMREESLYRALSHGGTLSRWFSLIVSHSGQVWNSCTDTFPLSCVWHIFSARVHTVFFTGSPERAVHQGWYTHRVP